MEEIIEELKQLDTHNEDITYNLLLLYKYVGELLINDRFNEVDDFILCFVHRSFSYQMCIGLLTITNFYKGKLEDRDILYDYTLRKLTYSIGKNKALSVLNGLI